MRSVLEAYSHAFSWAATRKFAGYDPYDALSSPLLNTLQGVLGRPFGIAATQLVRRSPINLRPLLRIAPVANAKGLALFLSAAALTGRRDDAHSLRDRLRSLRSKGWDVPCWGYPFPWQSRAFYLPAGTPTVVATSFAAEAFLDVHALLGDARDLEMAVGACRFVTEVLHRTKDVTGECLSYSPLDRSAVYNASILGARLLVRTGVVAGRDDLIAQAEPLVRFVLARQHDDGSWAYGDAGFHRWIDSFHTGFVLSALDVYARATHDSKALSAVRRGAALYKEKFFGPLGEPYYFIHQHYPYDVHSAAQALVTLTQLIDVESSLGDLADKVAEFMINEFLSANGHFRYQIRRTHNVSIPYMRWSQAWGVRGLAAMIHANRR